MADLNTAQKAPLLVTDADGNVVPIVPFSIGLSGEPGVVTLSGLTGDGRIDVVAQAVGTASVDVNIPGYTPVSLTVTVEAAPEDPGLPTLTLALGTPVAK